MSTMAPSYFARVAPVSMIFALGASLSCAVVSCSGGGFDPPSKVASVRVLASRVDKPYAAPGDTVNLEVLAFDGRKVQPEPMRISWVPTACINPRNDAYYGCFAALGGGGRNGDAGAGDAGGGGMKGGSLPTGVDLTPFLPSGPKLSITLPVDIIDTHPHVEGAADPYGLAVAFNIACAGHVELLPIDPNNINPQSPPIGCFDKDHNRLGADDYVIGFTRVFAYATRTNANPVIDHVTFAGATVDPNAGVTVGLCASGAACPENSIDVVVPSSSQEPNPGDVDQNGVIQGEQIWVDYFTTDGSFGSDARLLYDAKSGAVPGTENKYSAPDKAAEGSLWVVVHDNRDGTSWLQIPLHVQ